MASNSGVLYVVATPIGNLADISRRAKEVLSMVDVIAAEDTRHARPLLNHLGIETPCIAFHEHNEHRQLQHIIRRLNEGQNVALISDAGTPLISDPGYPLIAALHQQQLTVVPIPGASAITSALSVSGLATDRFTFEGFLPAKSSGRRKALQQVVNEQRTMVFYESCHRITASLEDMREILGRERQITVCRELTKRFETIHQSTLADICDWIQQPEQQKGEFVLVIAGNKSAASADQQAAWEMLETLLDYLSPSQAAAATAQLTGMKKRDLYQKATEIQQSK